MKITPNQFAWIFLIVLVALLGWGGVAVYRFIQNPAEEIISVENEKRLGELLEQRNFGEANGIIFVQNPFADSCIQTIYAKLLSGIEKTNYHYEIKLILKKEPNAFAIPGGKIFVNTGLILFCNSSEEFAAVLAHEMGHVEKRHTVNSVIKNVGVSALLSMIVDSNEGAVDQLSGQLLSGYFSREDEAEADDFALNLLDRCQIKPSVLGEVFMRMKEESGDMEGVMNLLSTHPELEQRSLKASSYVTASSFIEKKIDVDWQRFQEFLKSSETS